MRWRKLLAVFFGAGSTSFTILFVLFTDHDLSTPVRTVQLLCAAIGSATLITSVAAWRGRTWSLWALRLLVAAGLSCVALLGILDMVEHISLGESVLRVVAEDCLLIAGIGTVPAFLLAILYQRDVVADFTKQGQGEP